MELTHYIRGAARHLRRYREYALINYATLALGLFCCFSLLVVVDHELGYDEFSDADRLFRIDYRSDFRGGAMATYARGPSAMLGHLAEVPEVEAAAALIPRLDIVSETPANDLLVLGDVFYATPEFFSVFDFEVREGRAERALAEPGDIVLTHATSMRLFGTSASVGRTVTSTDGASYTVSAVLAPDPPASHLRFDALVHCPEGVLSVWNGLVAATYVRLKATAAAHSAEDNVNAVIRAHAPPPRSEDLEASLRPVRSIHLTSHLSDELAPNGDLKALVVFGGAAVLLMLMGSLNFMNLTTLHYIGRSPEVGVRKTFGVRRHQLIGQFLGESFVLAALAGGTALVLAVAVRPWILAANGVAVDVGWAVPLDLVVWLLAISALTGIAAGLYPAVTLSGASPIVGLQRSLLSGRSAARMRQGFLTFQLAVTALFIISSTAVIHQLHYIASQDLGYDPEGVYYLELSAGVTPERYELLRRTLLQRGDVDVVSYGSIPGEGTGGFAAEGPGGEMQLLHRYLMGPDYLEALGMTLARGRKLGREHAGVDNGMLLNASASVLMGAQGSGGTQVRADGRRREVVGVIEDFHFYSLKQPVVPVYAYEPEWVGPNLIVRARGSLGGAEVDEVQAVIDRFLPDNAYSLVSMERRLREQYAGEERLADLLGSFSTVAFFVALLGLYALNAYFFEKRKKEVGVKLVFGASFKDLYLGLVKESLAACTLAVVIASVVAYVFWWWWASHFAYRAGFPYPLVGVIYGVAVLITLAVAWVRTRAAMATPPASVIGQP